LKTLQNKLATQQSNHHLNLKRRFADFLVIRNRSDEDAHKAMSDTSRSEIKREGSPIEGRENNVRREQNTTREDNTRRGHSQTEEHLAKINSLGEDREAKLKYISQLPKNCK